MILRGRKRKCNVGQVFYLLHEWQVANLPHDGWTKGGKVFRYTPGVAGPGGETASSCLPVGRPAGNLAANLTPHRSAACALWDCCRPACHRHGRGQFFPDFWPHFPNLPLTIHGAVRANRSLDPPVDGECPLDRALVFAGAGSHTPEAPGNTLSLLDVPPNCTGMFSGRRGRRVLERRLARRVTSSPAPQARPVSGSASQCQRAKVPTGHLW
jgi:hypothetical protein